MSFKIGNRDIEKDDRTFVVAELSANHNQDFDLAVNTIKAIKKSGADAVKVQTYTPDILTLNIENRYFKRKTEGLWKGKTPYELYQEAYMPWEWQPRLKKVAEDLGLTFFSSPFDNSAVDFLERIGVPAYKIASFEITDIPLIEYTASKGKPIIFSTGVAKLEDVEAAVAACRKLGNNDIAILKCLSLYPAPYTGQNLRVISDLRSRFKTIVGLSDHSFGEKVAIAAVALGAKIVEKHFILDRNIGGPDSQFSMEPSEFKSMVKSIRDIESALGKSGCVFAGPAEEVKDHVRSLFVIKEVKKGEEFSLSNIRSIRPGYGLHPKYLQSLIGKRATKDIEKGTPLTWKLAM